MATTSPYQGGQSASTYSELDEHAVVSSVAGKKVFPIDLPPTAQTNPSYVVSYNAAYDTVKVVETIGATTYTLNITPESGDTVIVYTKTISSWT